MFQPVSDNENFEYCDLINFQYWNMHELFKNSVAKDHGIIHLYLMIYLRLDDKYVREYQEYDSHLLVRVYPKYVSFFR